MTNREDEQFENYLKGFRPVAPPALPAKRHRVTSRRLFAIAAGATATLAATFIIFSLLSRNGSHTPRTSVASGLIAGTKRSQIAAPALTKLALENPGAFDALMAERSHTQMPAMKGEQSALRILAKE